MGCTLPRAPAVRARSEGSEGQQQGSFSGCLPPRLSAARRAPGSKCPWLGFAAPHSQRLTPCLPRKCVTDVASLALSSPSETFAGGWGLTLRVWVPAHSLNSGEAAPEARPAGGALRPHLIGSAQPAGKRASSGEEEAAQPRQVESPACTELNAPPVRQSSSSAQSPDLAEFLARGCSAGG